MKSYKHFTPEERECLSENLRKGKNPSEIARIIGRSRSSVYREIKRNKNRFGCYNAIGAIGKYLSRRKNAGENISLIKTAS